jgi:aryl-alcohol dehydrogenase-like predicted oxidoreductase
MGLGDAPREGSWSEVALRFSAHCPGVTSAIVGTRDLAHFKQNLAWVAKGPLPPVLLDRLRAAFQSHDRDWHGLI